jgi:hypothetical protein
MRVALDMDRVCKSVQHGAKLFIGRDHAGRQKVKLVKGPFGLFVERFECTEDELKALKRMINERAKRDWKSQTAA